MAIGMTIARQSIERPEKGFLTVLGEPGSVQYLVHKGRETAKDVRYRATGGHFIPDETIHLSKRVLGPDRGTNGFEGQHVSILLFSLPQVAGRGQQPLQVVERDGLIGSTW